MSERGDVYRLVFELTARATDVPYDHFLKELVEGLAQHYRARVCRIHVGENLQPVATSDVDDLIGALSPDDRARLDTVDSMLAAEVKRDGVLRMALDLDGGEEIVNFLARKMMTPETFAFPLMARGRAFGAITLFLDEAYPFDEADVRGLQAVGNVLYAANNRGDDFLGPNKQLPTLTDEKLKSYQGALTAIRKVLEELQLLTDAKCVLLLDNQGDFVSKAGEESIYSTTNFSTIVASGFAAGRRLAGMYGGQEFPSVTHEADGESVFVIEVAKRALLCVVYRDHETPGLIRRWTQGAANRITTHYDRLVEATAL